MSKIHFSEEEYTSAWKQSVINNNRRVKYAPFKVVLLWFLLAIPIAAFIFANALEIINLNIFLFLLILFAAIIGGGFLSQYITNNYIYRKNKFL